MVFYYQERMLLSSNLQWSRATQRLHILDWLHQHTDLDIPWCPHEGAGPHRLEDIAKADATTSSSSTEEVGWLPPSAQQQHLQLRWLRLKGQSSILTSRILISNNSGSSLSNCSPCSARKLVSVELPYVFQAPSMELAIWTCDMECNNLQLQHESYSSKDPPASDARYKLIWSLNIMSNDINNMHMR